MFFCKLLSREYSNMHITSSGNQGPVLAFDYDLLKNHTDRVCVRAGYWPAKERLTLNSPQESWQL